MRTLVYYVAASLDGFIADTHGDFSMFPQHPDTLAALFRRYPETCPVQAREVLGVTGENRRFDTVVMGSRTFAPALAAGLPGGAYPHLCQVVATSRRLDGVETVADDLCGYVERLKQGPGGDIWLCGGGTVAGALAGLIDEIQVKVNPIVLGDGIRLFEGLPSPLSLRTVATEELPGGVVLHTYQNLGVTS